MRLSTVPIGVAAQAHQYLAEGGPGNLAQLHAFCLRHRAADRRGFRPADPAAGLGAAGPPGRRPRRRTARGSASCTTGRIRRPATPPSCMSLADAVRGAAGARPSRCRSSVRRCAAHPTICWPNSATLGRAGRHGAGGRRHQTRHRDRRRGRRGVGRHRPGRAGHPDPAGPVPDLVPGGLGRLRRGPHAAGCGDPGGGPGVRRPDHHGAVLLQGNRSPTGLPYYVADPERCARVAGIAVAHARLRHIPPADRKIAIMLSAYPTKHSRIGNAVGLDTPVSAIRLFRAMRAAGYDLGPARRCRMRCPGWPRWSRSTARNRTPPPGNALIHALIAAGGQDEEWLTAEQLSRQSGADPGRHGTPAGWPSCRPS